MKQAASIERVVDHQVAALFVPSVGTGLSSSDRPRLGLELEFFVRDLEESRRSVMVSETRRALATDAALLRKACVSFEPGGQLELSLPPAESPRTLIRAAEEVVQRVGAALGRHGLRAEARGVDNRPGDDQVLQVSGARYRAMGEHFDSIGPAGRRMMCRTAALQVCTDFTPGVEGRRQWLVANAVGPALAAAFRNPPGPDNRTSVWRAVDETRTGFDGCQVDENAPVDAYARFALDAHVMPLPRRAAAPVAGVPRLTTLREWATVGGSRPDEADVAHHLSTLFPPVRPRGYLEVRWLDAQPLGGLRMATALLAILLTDRDAGEEAIGIVATDGSTAADAWARSAERGLDDARLRAVARDVVDAVVGRADAVARRWPGWLPDDARVWLSCLASHLRERDGSIGTGGVA